MSRGTTVSFLKCLEGSCYGFSAALSPTSIMNNYVHICVCVCIYIYIYIYIYICDYIVGSLSQASNTCRCFLSFVLS